MFIKNHRRKAALCTALLTALLTPQLAAIAATAEDPAAVPENRLEREGGPARDASIADDAGDWQESTLTGDWNGARQRLSDAGIEFEFLLTADYLRNNTGGLERGGGTNGHIDLIMQLDGEKLFGWQGGSAYLQVISNSGSRVNLNYVGSLMGVDNIEAPVNRSGIFQAWLQQSFLDDKASLRVGLYPIDSEFYVTDSSGVFLHPSFGMSAEAGDFGTLAGPSIYATSEWGTRLRIDPDPAWYGMLAVTRGVPSDLVEPGSRGACRRTGDLARRPSVPGHWPVAGNASARHRRHHARESRTRNRRQRGLLPPAADCRGKTRSTRRIRAGNDRRRGTAH